MYSTNNKRLVGTIAVSLAAMCAAATGELRAEAPEPVVRTFGLYVRGGAEIPDFEDDNSIAVTALPLAIAGGSAGFALTSFPSGAHDFEGSRWQSHPAHHATKAANWQDSGIFFWAITEDTPAPPPVGAHTFTGTESPFILDAQVFYVRPCVSADEGETCNFGDVANGKWVLLDQADAAANAFVVVTALFSK